MEQFKTPILIIGYNRPDKISKVLQVVSLIKPSHIYFAVDGPKDNQDMVNVELTKKAISAVNWNPKVFTKFEVKNLGCRRNVSSAIDWFFEHNEAGIILEDDIIPSISFFQFCAELIERYKKSESIYSISGCNVFEKNYLSTKESYIFSRFVSVWGWATWRDAWNEYRSFEKYAEENIDQVRILLSKVAPKSYVEACIKTLEGKIDTWDYIWSATILINGGLNIIPKNNLIHNQGFGKDATHTKFYSRYARLEAAETKFPLIHPTSVEESDTYRREYEKSRSRFSLIMSIFEGLLSFIFNR